MKYVITTGWWCSDNNAENRDAFIGDDTIRDRDFHKIWYDSIRATGSSAKIFIIDSASPVKPILEDSEELISFEHNFGHSTRCSYKLSGVTRAHIMGMMVALLNEYEYWVYIEQDALVQGKGIIEKCIESMKKPMAFGNGRGTPYPAQQSFMIIKTSAVPKFINRLTNIRSPDKAISPELKFCIASSPILSAIPEFIYRYIERRGAPNKAARLLVYYMVEKLRGFDYIPFGYGRSRPIDFSDDLFYFQHGSAQEISDFTKKTT